MGVRQRTAERAGVGCRHCLKALVAEMSGAGGRTRSRVGKQVVPAADCQRTAEQGADDFEVRQQTAERAVDEPD